MRVIVIGGGAVGLCVAEALAGRGCEVSVVEAGRCGAGASAGNAGWVTPSLSIPVPGPGVIATSLRWLVNPSGPLWIRPTLAPAMLGWIARFMLACRRPAYRRGLLALQAAAARAGAAFERLAERGVAFELHEDPLLYPAFSRNELDHLSRVADELREVGVGEPMVRLSRSATRELEPTLGEAVLGGLLVAEERRVRPELLVAGLQKTVLDNGGEVLEHTAVSAITRDRAGWLVTAPGAERRGDALVLANGVGSARLLAPLGLRLPIAAAKGYSRTYPRDLSGPSRPLYLEEPKVSVSVFDGGVRISGTLELGARTLALSPRRLAAITAAAQAALPAWRMGEPVDWAGMRSLSPDGLPYLGEVPGHERLYLATAHATLGITLGPLSGELLAELIADRRRSPLLEPFDPGRVLTKATTGEPQ